MMFRKSNILRLFSLLLIAGLVFACLPAADVQAASGETLYVANWTAATDAGVAGRPTVVQVGDTYHMWYAPSDTTLYHTTSTDPASFSTGTLTEFDTTPLEVASPAIFEEGGVFYMVTYKTDSNLIFSLYSSGDGDSWNYVKDVFDASSFSDINKIDAPFVFNDSGTFRLYFQLKNAAKTSYKIYTAESTQAITDSDFAFTLANSGDAVLVPGPSGTWDSNYVMHPWVIKDNGVYFMYYSAYGTSQVIGLAKSTDGYNWVKSQANPILGPVGEPVVLNDSGTWHMWYLGSGSVVKYFTSTGPIEISSIQAAINKATGGETIMVAPGTYNEAVVINKANIALLSAEGNDETFIYVPDGTLTTGVKISGTNLGTITVDGFTVSNFTEGGIIQGMGSATGTTVHVLNNIVAPKADYLRNGIQVSGNGSSVIGNWIGGARLTTKWGSTGILAVNSNNIIIQNNVLEGDGLGFDYGIEILNYSGTIMDNIQVLNNTITHADYAMDVYAYAGKSITNVNFEGNKVTFYVAGASNGTQDDTALLSNIDYTHNWFGSASGPSAVDMGIAFPYAAWCADEGCTTFAPVDGMLELPSGVTAAEIQQAINNAPAGTTVVIPAGTYNFAGGYTVANPNITILLSDGVIIQNESPCFAVNASYTKITTESIGGAICLPTSSSNGFDVAAGLTNVIIEGLEINGANGTDGINFAGAITDVQIVNNYIHDLPGNGVTFVEQPTGVVDIQGNLFNFIGGMGISAPSSLGAEYNSWGTYAEPTNAGCIDYDPWTHADLYMVDSGTPWTDMVLPGNNITYTVYANLKNVTGLEFQLPLPAGFTLVSAAPITGAFLPANGSSVLDTTTPGVIGYAGYTTNSVVSMEDLPLFTFTITAPLGIDPSSFDLAVDSTSDKFSMSPVSGGPSNNVYAAVLGGETLNLVTIYPELTSLDFAGPYAAGYAQEFSITVANPAGGVLFDTPQLQFTGLPVGTSLEYWDATLATPAWVPVSGGAQNLPESAAGTSATYLFRVTFPEAASIAATINLVDTDFANILDSLSATVVVNSNYTVTGTFSMQGRTVRSGIPVTLTMVAPALYGPFNASSLDIISGNTIFTNIPVASYVITTNQPRYLDVTVDLGKTKAVSANTALAALELKGGDANDDNIVEVGDASIIGAQYGNTGAVNNGDVNFSNIVDIFDLAIVGGNLDIDSADAYGVGALVWIP